MKLEKIHKGYQGLDPKKFPRGSKDWKMFEKKQQNNRS